MRPGLVWAGAGVQAALKGLRGREKQLLTADTLAAETEARRRELASLENAGSKVCACVYACMLGCLWAGHCQMARAASIAGCAGRGRGGGAVRRRTPLSL